MIWNQIAREFLRFDQSLCIAKCNCGKRVFGRSVDQFVRIYHINQTIALSIIKSDDSHPFEQNAWTLRINFFLHSDRISKYDRSSLTACYWYITRIFCQTKSSFDTTGFCTRVETCDTTYIRIRHCTYFDLMIRSQELKCGIDWSDIILSPLWRWCKHARSHRCKRFR